MNDKRLYFSVAKQLRELISEGMFPPGSRLPAERDLAEKLGVSRVTIREAEIALEAVGLVDIRIGSGVYVMNSSEPARPAIGACELTEARAAIEAEAAALAATAITDVELDKLDRIVDCMADETSASDQHDFDTDRDFHFQIASASRNKAMIETIKQLWRYRSEISDIRSAHESIRKPHSQERLNEHRAISIALRKRDPELARNAMRTHFKCIIGSMLDVAEERAVADVRRRTKENRARFLEGTPAL
ncbi:MAG: FadR family transcriptional regulator [Marinicaulis sp.]|nr:FadR family transcriptional regulator [Marinicaulis sp.]